MGYKAFISYKHTTMDGKSVTQEQSAPRPKAGDIVPFGQYPQGAGGGVQPLMWRVLDVQDGRALLITDKLIDYHVYHAGCASVTWADCTLRQWLHNEFMQQAFSFEEQAKIVTVTNQNPNNPQYDTTGGNTTQDKIFLLSIGEAERYFSSGKDRRAFTTDDAHKQGYDKKDRSGWWWLRSPGSSSYYAAYVRNGGLIYPHGYYVFNCSVAVRPALWLNL